jgi:hypothetical protein
MTALMNLLTDEGVRHAAVEVEALGLGHPLPDDDIALGHLESLARSFGEHGYPLLLVGATVDSPDYLQRLIDAVGADQRLLVRLKAPVPVLTERIKRREPPEWTGLQRLLDATGPLAATHARLPGVDLVLNTESAEPRAIAMAIRDAMSRA